MIAELTVEPREAEHADLVGDVVPGPWRLQTLELFLQLSPHQQDPVGHLLHVLLPADGHREASCEELTRSGCSHLLFSGVLHYEPFSKQLRRVQRDGDDPGPLGRRVGPRGPDNLLHLGQNPPQVVCVPSHNGQVPHALV